MRIAAKVLGLLLIALANGCAVANRGDRVEVLMAANEAGRLNSVESEELDAALTDAGWSWDGVD